MLKILGSLLIMATGVFLSYTLCNAQKKKLTVTEALIDLTEYIRSSIYTSRLPLSEIYTSFNNTKLSEYGFIYQLNSSGLDSALNTVSEHISEKSHIYLKNLAENLGGINTETQIRLCEETSRLLREELKKEEDIYIKKDKMYKTLPLLLASSIIIMLI